MMYSPFCGLRQSSRYQQYYQAQQMKNKHIIEYLDYYIKSETINFAVLLKGTWGSGKTYFIKKLIENWETPNVANDDFIALSPIYISLNGISSKNEIIQKLREKINPFLYSKGVKFTTAILKGFIKSTVKIDFDSDKDGATDGSFNLDIDPITIFKGDNENIKGNRIIIFDDIERCKVPIDEVYGFINDFVEHSKCKIILISDEEKILEKEKKEPSTTPYASFKEKIIGQTFEILPNTEEAIEYFISLIKSEVCTVLNDNKNLILKIFNSSEKNNLRVLQRALFEFERLVNLLENISDADKPKYNLLIKSLLAYYLIYHIEFNTGNKLIKNFQQLFLLDDQKLDYQNYEELIKSEDLLHSTKIFSPENIISFIEGGHYEQLVEEVNNNYLYKPEEEKNWEKLWYWKFLSDSEFKILLEIVEKDFFEDGNLHFTEVLHISGILFNLIDNNLYQNKNKAEIIDKAYSIFSDITDFSDVEKYNSLLRNSWRKSYASEQTVEFRQLIAYLQNCIKLKQGKNLDKLVENKLYSLNDENIDELYDSFKEYNWGVGKIIEQTPIFKNIDHEKFCELILRLSNKGIFDLNGYFNYRYYPERTYANLRIEDFHKSEREFIIALKELLKTKIENINDQPLKVYALSNFLSDLENIALKLQ